MQTKKLHLLQTELFPRMNFRMNYFPRVNSEDSDLYTQFPKQICLHLWFG